MTAAAAAERRRHQATVVQRATQAAVVAAAAMFGGVGMAQAAAMKEQQQRVDAARGGATAFSPQSSSSSLGATDLGILLAEAPEGGSSNADEEKERARKLAEVRRIKAERQAALNTKKGKNKKGGGDDAADKASDEKGGSKKGSGKKGGKKGGGGSDGDVSAAEKKKAERIKAAKEKAFAEALEREKAAMAADAAGAGGDGMHSEETQAELEESAAKLEARMDEKLAKLAAMEPASLKDPKLQHKEKTFVGAMMEKITGPRFVRNVNLRYLRDPFCAKGTNAFPTECAYTGFYELCESNRVTRVVYQPNMNSVKFFLKDTDEVFFSNLPYDPTLYTMMVARGIDIVSKQYTPLELFVRTSFNVLTPAVLIYFCWVLWQEIEGGDTTEGSTLQNTGTTKTYQSQPRTGLTMKDIAGIDVVREEMEELISYLRDYQKYAKAGAIIPSGVLLCGPPGTGKTLLARCLAGEAQVPFFSVAGTEFMEMFVGVGAARIRNLFKQARDVKPCIIFIDEFDSVAVRRKDATSSDVQGNDEQVATINQLLTEMDGFGGNTGVMVFAATNRPHVIDPALIRPGRFDRIIEMPLPNRRAREDIIDLHSSYPQYEGLIDPDIDVQLIARQAAGFTGADLENLVRSAALRNAAAAKRGNPADNNTFIGVIDEIRRSNVFKSTGVGTVGETDETTENALIQQMNPYVRDTITTYFAAQTLVAMMVPNYDEVAKVRVFAGGEETGQIVYVPDEVGVEGAAQVKRRAWYESKMAVLVSGQMAERYLYGPDKVSQFGVLDMREATAMACEMVMLHGWSDLGPLCVLQDSSNEEKYLKKGNYKGASGMGGDSRIRGKMLGMPSGKIKPLAQAKHGAGQGEDATLFMLGISDELDLLIANEVRKIFIKACQRAVMILHEPKGTEMLFTLREALAQAKEINGPNLRAVFSKFGLEPQREFSMWDLEWGKQNELYWDEFVNHIWADDPSNTGFWKLVQEQWGKTVQEPTEKVREAQAKIVRGDDPELEPDLPEWAREYVRSLPVNAQEEMLMYAPKEVQERIRNGRPAVYTGPGFGKRDIRTEFDIDVGGGGPAEEEK